MVFFPTPFPFLSRLHGERLSHFNDTSGKLNITEAEPLVQVSYDDGSNGNMTTLAVELSLIILATITVGLRLYSRFGVKRKFALDDGLIIAALACGIARLVVTCMSTNDKYGYDKDGPNQRIEIPYYQHIFIRRICYILAVFFTRLSVLSYYLRIFPPGLTSLRRCSYILLVLTIAQLIEVLTVLCVECSNIHLLWTSRFKAFTNSGCFTDEMYSYSAAIGDSVLDCLIFALPMPYVWGLRKIKARQRLGLIIIFGLGFFVCVVALLQIPFIKKRQEHTTYFGGAITMLVAIQISLAIIAASLPDIRALVARSFPNFSPLHHRSLNSRLWRGGRNSQNASDRAEIWELRELENQFGDSQPVSGTPSPTRGFNRLRGFKKPDWLRSSIPASLMSTAHTDDTRVTYNGIERRDTRASLPGVEKVLHVPRRKSTFEGTIVHATPSDRNVG